MKCLTFLLLTALPVVAQTNLLQAELKTARRIVDGRTMDITPLINWVHLKPATERPLKGWLRVQGRVLGENSYGWVVQGSFDGVGQPKPFILRNPPKESRDEFNRMKTQYAALQRRQTNLQAGIKEAQEAFDANKTLARQALLFFIDERDPNFIRRGQMQEDLTQVQTQLQQLEARGHDLRGEFVTKCYALKTFQQFNGMLIYDHGYVLK